MDWFHVVLWALLLAHIIGWVRILIRLSSLLDDIASSAAAISALTRSCRDQKGRGGI